MKGLLGGELTRRALSAPRGRCRHRLRAVTLWLPMLVLAVDAQAQRFAEFGARLDESPAADQSAAAERGPVPFTAGIDIEMLRSAPQRLELPTPDGRVLVAELTVFEDRGDGDFMWAGGSSEAGFESVVLTVRDGHLVGRFDEPGAAGFRLTSTPTGRGRILDLAEMGRDRAAGYCPGGVAPEERLPVPAAKEASMDLTVGRAGASSAQSLDVLVVYEAAAKKWWERNLETPESAAQHAVDYLNLVLRNGQLDVTARLVHVAEASTLPTPGAQDQCGWRLERLSKNREVARMRAEHGADVVHLFLADESVFLPSGGPCGGIAYLLTGETLKSDTFWPLAYSLTNLVADGLLPERTFAHEIGHNLGLRHDPECHAAGDFESIRAAAIAPYAFGHVLPGVKTIMACGAGQPVSWFSTVRVEPMGLKLGIRDERESERALRELGLGAAVRFSDFLPDLTVPPEPPSSVRPFAPWNLTVQQAGPASVRLTWVDAAANEDGFEVQSRPHDRESWDVVARLEANVEVATIGRLPVGVRYQFQVRAYNEYGLSDSHEVVTISLREPEFSDCVPSAPQIEFGHGYTVSMCVEYLKDGIGPPTTADANNYNLDSEQSGLLYFFDRDNVEMLVKVLDACAVNGHRWVFVAPVTDLAFNLHVDETATGKRWTHRNPKGGRTASTRGDVAAFPCGDAATVVAGGGGGEGAFDGVELVASVPRSGAFERSRLGQPAVDAEPIGTGQGTDCEPTPVVVLGEGYIVRMCYETREGKVGQPRDWGLDSRQSALLYFFDRDNAEVLVKVLEGCGVNGHQWVFVAPVTDLAFNLSIQAPSGESWMHYGYQGLTASARSNIEAFACSR